ncbi:MAG: hypothetical protein Tsb0021_11630 [Chlamydiales bacterium]
MKQVDWITYKIDHSYEIDGMVKEAVITLRFPNEPSFKEQVFFESFRSMEYTSKDDEGMTYSLSMMKIPPNFDLENSISSLVNGIEESKNNHLVEVERMYCVVDGNTEWTAVLISYLYHENQMTRMMMIRGGDHTLYTLGTMVNHTDPNDTQDLEKTSYFFQSFEWISK